MIKMEAKRVELLSPRPFDGTSALPLSYTPKNNDPAFCAEMGFHGKKKVEKKVIFFQARLWAVPTRCRLRPFHRLRDFRKLDLKLLPEPPPGWRDLTDSSWRI